MLLILIVIKSFNNYKPRCYIFVKPFWTILKNINFYKDQLKNIKYILNIIFLIYKQFKPT